MDIDKNTYIPHVKKFSKLIGIINTFFINKEYNKKKFINNLNSKIYNETNLKLDNKRLCNLLINYNKYKEYFNKVDSLKNKFDEELCINCNQKGGFFYNKYDNKFMKALTIVDFLFDIINLIPNQIITNNFNFVTMPYGIASLLINLFRGDYDFAFYSFLGIIPGIGGVLASSAKLIHRMIRFMIDKKKVENVEDYYKQIQSARRVHDFIKDENYNKLKNPYSGEFENKYNYDEEIEDLYLK